MQFSRRLIELTVSSATFIIGLAIITDSVHLGIGWTNNSPEPGYFPFRVGVILAIASLGIAIQSRLDRSPHIDYPFVTWARFKLVLAVFVPTALYVVGVATVGMYVSSAFFIAAFMLVSGRFNFLTTIAVSVGTALVLFFLFEIEFLVPLPKGPLEAWLGF